MSVTSPSGSAWCTPAARSAEVRDFLLENMAEEEGIVGMGEFGAVRHTDLLLDFAGHCGVERAEIVDAQLNGELLRRDAGPAGLVLPPGIAPFRGSARGAQDRARVAGPGDLPQDHGVAHGEVRVRRGRDHVLPAAHRRRRRAWRARPTRSSRSTPTTDEARASCVRLVREAAGMRRLYARWGLSQSASARRSLKGARPRRTKPGASRSFRGEI